MSKVAKLAATLDGVEVINSGTDNLIDVPDSVQGRLHVNGNYNRVVIAPEHASTNVTIDINGDHATVTIGHHCILSWLSIYQTSRTLVTIGEEVDFNGMVRLQLHEPASITIGAKSLIAGNTDLTVSDMHGIFDQKTRKRVNPARSIILRDRCWIGQSCFILKGVQIGPDSVIGANSVVTKSIPANCVAAGSPAKVVRREIFWDRSLSLPATNAVNRFRQLFSPS